MNTLQTEQLEQKGTGAHEDSCAGLYMSEVQQVAYLLDAGEDAAS